MLPSFPQFAPLTLEDKDSYEALIAEYPPLSDISFATLHIWWNLEGQLSTSLLNNNLMINYQLPFDKVNSGYCLIGKERIDDSIQTIFDFLRQQNRTPRLVHVPEFVVERIRDKDKLLTEEEQAYNEYILDSQAIASLEGSLHGRLRRKVNRFLREVENRAVEIKPLDLSSEQAKGELFEAIVAWEKAHPRENDPEQTEHAAIKKTLTYASALNIQHLGLYVDGKLYAIILYHQPANKDYYIIHHLKVDYSLPYIFDYMTHHIANKAVQENIKFLNMEMDLGIESLRQYKMGLRPVNFFRKFTIEPAR